MGGTGGGMPGTVAPETVQPTSPTFEKSAFSFAGGGMVPGPIGQPYQATVHGGETILPPGGLYALIQMLGRGRDLDTRGM